MEKKRTTVDWERIWNLYKTFPFFRDVKSELLDGLGIRAGQRPSGKQLKNFQRALRSQVKDVVHNNKYVSSEKKEAYAKKLSLLCDNLVSPRRIDELATNLYETFKYSYNFSEKPDQYEDRNVYLKNLKKLKELLEYFQKLIFQNLEPLLYAHIEKKEFGCQFTIEKNIKELVEVVDYHIIHPPKRKSGPLSKDYRKMELLDFYIYLHFCYRYKSKEAIDEISSFLKMFGQYDSQTDYEYLRNILNRAARTIKGRKTT